MFLGGFMSTAGKAAWDNLPLFIQYISEIATSVGAVMENVSFCWKPTISDLLRPRHDDGFDLDVDVELEAAREASVRAVQRLRDLQRQFLNLLSSGFMVREAAKSLSISSKLAKQMVEQIDQRIQDWRHEQSPGSCHGILFASVGARFSSGVGQTRGSVVVAARFGTEDVGVVGVTVEDDNGVRLWHDAIDNTQIQMCYGTYYSSDSIGRAYAEQVFSDAVKTAAEMEDIGRARYLRDIKKIVIDVLSSHLERVDKLSLGELIRVVYLTLMSRTAQANLAISRRSS